MSSVSNDESDVVRPRKIDTSFDVLPLLGKNNVSGEVADRTLGIGIVSWQAGVVGPQDPVVGYSPVAPTTGSVNIRNEASHSTYCHC